MVKPLNHEENREKVCLLCFKKAIKSKPVHNTLKSVIKEHFLPGFDSSEIYPKVLCGGCYVAVYRRGKGDTHKEINVHDYSRDHFKATRKNSERCLCNLCSVAREKLQQLPPKVKHALKTPDFVKICKRCISEIHPGKSHKCWKLTKVNNLVNMAGDDRTKAQVAAVTIRDQKAESGIVELPNTRGKKTRLQLKLNSPEKPTQIQHQQVLRMKTDLNLSVTKTLKMARNLREGNRSAVQPGLKSALKAMLHELDDFFYVEKLSFTTTGEAKTAERSVVLCKSVSGLVQYVAARRNASDYKLKLGIDGGQGSLKICLNIEEKSPLASNFKDSGVRKSFIIALAPDVAENYHNVEVIWTKLDLHVLDAIVTGDLKIVNILAGVMANSATFPCAYCTVRKDELGSQTGTLRTFGAIRKYAKQWRDDGKVLKKAKDYQNCANSPLLAGDDSTTVLSRCPPPSLHIFLGLMNALYNTISSKDPALSSVWVKAANATRHEQFGFAGRHCRNLLKKRGILKENAPIYFSILESMNSVVDACFGVQLKPAFSLKIAEFCEKWQAAELPATPKFHILKVHVAEFCRLHQQGLARFTEQTIETMHQDYDKTWVNYKVPESHDDYEQKLCDSVVAYNSGHII